VGFEDRWNREQPGLLVAVNAGENEQRFVGVRA